MRRPCLLLFLSGDVFAEGVALLIVSWDLGCWGEGEWALLGNWNDGGPEGPREIQTHHSEYEKRQNTRQSDEPQQHRLLTEKVGTPLTGLVTDWTRTVHPLDQKETLTKCVVWSFVFSYLLPLCFIIYCIVFYYSLLYFIFCHCVLLFVVLSYLSCFLLCQLVLWFVVVFVYLSVFYNYYCVF